MCQYIISFHHIKEISMLIGQEWHDATFFKKYTNLIHLVTYDKSVVIKKCGSTNECQN